MMMTSGICASTASITASLTPIAGTKTTETSAPVATIVSPTVPKTGSCAAPRSTVWPALRGLVPPTTLVPAASMRRPCLRPSDPVIPWIRTRLCPVRKIAISRSIRGRHSGGRDGRRGEWPGGRPRKWPSGRRGGWPGGRPRKWRGEWPGGRRGGCRGELGSAPRRTVHGGHLFDHADPCIGQDPPAFVGVVSVQPQNDRAAHDLAALIKHADRRDDAARYLVAGRDAAEYVNEDRAD